MKNNDFVEASVFLRMREKRMLTGADIGRLADTPGVAELIKLISALSDIDLTAISRPQDYAAALAAELKKLYAMGYELANGADEIVDIAACKYSYHNVKTAVKLRFLGAEGDHIYSDIGTGDLSPELIKAGVQNSGDLSQLPDYLAGPTGEALAAFEQPGGPGRAGMIIDRAMFARMLALCAEVGSELITEYVRKQIDYYNVKTLMRVKEMQMDAGFLCDALIEGGELPGEFFFENFTKTAPQIANAIYYKSFGAVAKAGLEDYGRTGTLSALERLLDNELIEQIKKVKYVAFGPENIFGYIIAKENEIRQIGILMTGKINSVPQAALRERLRENYA